MVPLDLLPMLIISWFKRTHWEDKAKYKALSRKWKNKKQKYWYLDKDWDNPPELKIKLAVLFFYCYHCSCTDLLCRMKDECWMVRVL